MVSFEKLLHFNLFFHKVALIPQQQCFIKQSKSLSIKFVVLEGYALNANSLFNKFDIEKENNVLFYIIEEIDKLTIHCIPLNV